MIKYFIAFIVFFFFHIGINAQVNDNCIDASIIQIPGNGFGNGLIYSDTINVTNATSQIGEYFPSGLPNGKSIWFKFSLATTKTITVLLNQTGNSPLNTAGWTLYKTNNCIPNINSLLNPPISQIEGYTHTCLTKGDYFLQLSADFSLSQSFFFSLDIRSSEAAETENDFAINAYDFGVINTTTPYIKTTDIGCQSIFPNEFNCDSLLYSKSIWQKFTTDNYIDLLRLEILGGYNNFSLNLYEGDVSIDSLNLTLIDSCQNFTTSSRLDLKCLLNPNTTYSIQILFKHDFFAYVSTKITQLGTSPTQGSDPYNLPSNNALGTLNLGSSYTITDYFDCNSYADYFTCAPYTDTIYSLLDTSLNPINWWITFELNDYGVLDINMLSSSYLTVKKFKLYKGSISDSCNLTALSEPYNCMEPGAYSILVSGRGHLPNTLVLTDLSQSTSIQINSLPIVPNLYSLATSSKIDSVNNLNPLLGNIVYSSTPNYIDCEESIIPDNYSCNTYYDRAMYRVIHIDRPGIIELSGGYYNFRYQVYEGDLSTNSIVNNEIIGANPMSCCISLYNVNSTFTLCVDSGLYTIGSFTNQFGIGLLDSIKVKFSEITQNPFTNPLMPEILPAISTNNLIVSSSQIEVDCAYNPDTILGLTPCFNYNNITYREFELLDTLSVTFSSNSSNSSRHRVFKGRRSNGNITNLEIDCFSSNYTTLCQTFLPGWYTIVSYNYSSIPQCGSIAGENQSILITATPPSPPKFNTFAKADSVYVNWFPRSNHTDSVPSQWQNINLTNETFDCNDDLNFPTGINSCQSNQNRVSYRVLHIAKPSFIFFHSPTNYLSHTLYEGDITNSSPPYNVMDSCFNISNKRMCIDSGIYTIASFTTDYKIGQSFSFSIYVDSLAESKYDFAANAYNFGTIPNDGINYLYNPSILSDANADAQGRPASNDFITCSTSAVNTEPNQYCSYYIPNTYNNNKKTLWYTFEIDTPGICTVNVNTLTPGKKNVSWAIYETSNNVYPLIDSIYGLSLVLRSDSSCFFNPNGDTSQLSFDLNSCDVFPKRYVVIVSNIDNPYITIDDEPNTQINVSVKLDQIPFNNVSFDHYSTANEINASPTTICNSPYNNDTISYGTFIGCEADLTCATKDSPDKTNCGNNTVWYKFTTDGNGTIKLNYFRDDLNVYDYNNQDIKLYKSTIDGDSINGLQNVNLTPTSYSNNPLIFGNQIWGQGCFSAGTYYIMFTGCNFSTAKVKPNIWLENITGDFCYDAIPITIVDEDSLSVSGSVDCWTIGEAPGENGTNMGCLGNVYNNKSGWFKIILDNDSIVDLDISLTENTTASSATISYRFASGDCNALTYQTCVNSGGFLTLNLKCRIDSIIYVQVVLPNYTTGTLNLNIKTTFSIDTACVPVNPNLPNSNFSSNNTCANQPTNFVNSSTLGSSLTYFWDFGDGDTSTLINPSHIYADTGTYLVSLIVFNGTLTDTSYNLVEISSNPQGSFSGPEEVCLYSAAQFINNETDSTTLWNTYWEIRTIDNAFYDFSFSFGNQMDYFFWETGEFLICLTNFTYDCPTFHCDTVTVLSQYINTVVEYSCNPNDTGVFVYENDSLNPWQCDSLITTYVNYKENFGDTIISYTCNILDTGTFSTNDTTVFGCDSITTTIVSLNNSYSDTIYNSSCLESDTGIFITNDTSSFGCDSITTNIINLNNSYSDTIYNSSCLESDTGIFIINDTSSLGCDSITTTIVSLINSYSDTIYNFSCHESDTGIFIINDTSSLGCDSITTTIISLNNSYSDTIYNFSCLESDTGIFITNDTSSFGCDSITTNIINLNNSYSDTIYNSSCLASDTGIFITNDTSSLGCDSITTTIVSLNNSYSDTFYNFSCHESDTGIFIINDTSSFGCDSITTTIISLNNSYSDTIYNSSCLESDTGIFIINNTSSFGCDSITTTIVSLNNSYSDTIYNFSCHESDTGIFIINDTSSFGCDSITTTIISLNNSYSDTIYNSSCLESDTGIFITNYTSSLGCDSNIIEVTNLVKPNDLLYKLQDTTFCKDEIGYVYIQESGTDFIWSDGTQGTSFSSNISGIYFVEFIQDSTNCIVTDSLEIIIEDCVPNCDITFPDAFTPNNDKLNDLFRPIVSDTDIKVVDFNIYNRWGMKVHNNIKPWDGYYNGVLQKNGAYTFYIKYTCGDDNKVYNYMGIINIIL